MRSKSPETMRQIEAFVNAFFDEHLRTPTMREIENGTGLSRQTASSYLRTMAEQGMLEYDGRGGIVTEHIRACASSQVVSLPIIGHVAAGVLTAAEEVREGFVEVPHSLLSGSDYFALKRLAHDGERYYLHPENPEFADIYPEELRIQGVAELMLRDLKQ